MGLLLLAATPALAEPLFRDDFAAFRGCYDFTPPQAWKIQDHAYRFGGQDHSNGLAVLNLGEFHTLEVEAELTVERRVAGGYVLAGLTLFSDPDNHWRLLLVDGPDDKAYFELSEDYRGVHQAERAAKSAAERLDGRQRGTLKSWSYARPYHLTLSLTAAEILGTVRDPATGQSWECRYALGNGPALRRGRPGLTANGTTAAFRNLVVTGKRMRSSPSWTPGPRGTVAIIPDESGQVASVLESLLSRDGFGVRLVPWDDLPRIRLYAADLDLLVLADARRLPDDAARLAASFLRAQGKLLAVGAPALGELLLKVGNRYLPVNRYREALYELLLRRPINVRPERWKRNCMNSARKATIRPDPAVTAGRGQAWRITADVDGWDLFAFTAEDLFAGSRDLLTFRARGDATTTRLAIECMERDGARWIASIPLSNEPACYVLRPGDFAFWPDSRATRGSGQRLNPAQAAQLSFGFSRSHTPQAASGVHSVWIADLATAADPDPDRPEPTPPAIEGLSPSHQIYPLPDIAVLAPAHVLLSRLGVADPLTAVAFQGKGFAAVGRETGIGFDRQRALRQVRVLDAKDRAGHDRGPLVWLMLGETTLPSAIWANVALGGDDRAAGGLARQIAGNPIVADAIRGLTRSMTRGCFLLEAGSRQFSYHAEEPVEIGALVVNAGRVKQTLAVAAAIRGHRGRVVFHETSSLLIPPGEQRAVRWEWHPTRADRDEFPCTVSTQLLVGPGQGQPIDAVAHAIELLPDEPARPEEFVAVRGSNFSLGGKSWFLQGVNYWPNNQGGRNSTRWLGRDMYDPQVIERDLALMESMGIHFLSGIQATPPTDEKDPQAYRDLHDFLNRCRRHEMKVFYTVPEGNPLAGGSGEAVRRHIEAAGLKNHPAILGWELAWEPIYYSGTKGGGMDFLLRAWNEWIVDRYGSLEAAQREWGQTIPRVRGPRAPQPSLPAKLLKTGQVAPPVPGAAIAGQWAAMPEVAWLENHGPWDRVVAAFRRFFSDYVGHAYAEVIREIRHYDPNHLITFRFGACGIPNKAWFAHCHSAGVAKHVDFLCPEGYNLQKDGPARPANPDDLRKGGLITLYYRFLSREKPVVWMEFGCSVNGMQTPWQTGRELVPATELQRQRGEFAEYYRMFVESGARGASPWWFPGGFRLGENSDFGIIEPDGTERPACAVLREDLPKFAAVPDHTCVAPADAAKREPGRPVITLDLDAHYADAWDFYAPQYLAAVRGGRLPYLTTRGTSRTSADCLLLAVGNTPCDGHNPPQFLNAEFNTVEFRASENSPCRPFAPGDVLTATRGSQVFCAASVGNLAEAEWLHGQVDQEGRVYLSCKIGPSGRSVQAPLQADTPYLGDAVVPGFALPLSDEPQQTVTLQMQTRRKDPHGMPLTIPFGEKWTFTVRLQDASELGKGH
jgi:hypothetical protein